MIGVRGSFMNSINKGNASLYGTRAAVYVCVSACLCVCRAQHSGPETGEGGKNSGHVSTSKVVKECSNLTYDPINGFLFRRAIH